jgi:hypothetical protein
MLKRIFSAAAIVIGLIAYNSQAGSGDRGFGIGVMLASPRSGITCKAWIGNPAAIDGGLSWSLREDWVEIHADYLYHFFNLIPVPQNKIAPYLGGGGLLHISQHPGIGARVPLGIDFIFDSLPLDVFLEIVPMVDLLPETAGDLHAAIGIRYFFGS